MEDVDNPARIVKTIRSTFETRRFYAILSSSSFFPRNIPNPKDYQVFNVIHVDDAEIVATSRHSKIAPGLVQTHLIKIEEFLNLRCLKINWRRILAVAFIRTHQELQQKINSKITRREEIQNEDSRRNQDDLNEFQEGRYWKKIDPTRGQPSTIGKPHHTSIASFVSFSEN
ncbi:hypothetical protein Trydic_g8373 [Trypoxylus dichotomus]